MQFKNIFITTTLLLACSFPAFAQDKGLWMAAGSSAKSITGDIAIADARVTIDYFNFPIGQIRALQPAEASALFDADVNAPGGGSLYRLAVPASRRFQHKNTLCGSDDVQWMVTWVQGRTLNVAFFSGADAPVFTMDALANSNDRCGTFTYSR
jgi:hypothetical protein